MLLSEAEAFCVRDVVSIYLTIALITCTKRGNKTS